METSLHSQHPRRHDVPLLIIVGLVTLGIGLFLPIVTLEKLAFSSRTYSVLTGIKDLFEGGNILLAGLIFGFSVLFPAFKLVMLLVIWFRRIDEGDRRRFLWYLEVLGKWSMLDVFVVIVMIGSIQLGILASGTVEPGVYVFGSAILISIAATFVVGRIAGAAEGKGAPERRRLGGSSMPLLAAVALALLTAGLTLPLMELEKWIFWNKDYSIVTATLEMASRGETILSAAVFFFVILLPVAKLIALLALSLIAPSRRSDRLVRWLLLLDKLSMVDVFCLALLVVTVKLGGLADVTMRRGFWFFAAGVLLSVYLSWRLHRRERDGGCPPNPSTTLPAPPPPSRGGRGAGA
jgi:paraquat-inducible protein A